MLQCTQAAAKALDRARAEQGLPGTFGVRLFPTAVKDGVMLGMTFTDTADEGDEVSEQYGTRLIIAPEVADQVADLTLDAVPDPTANGDAPPQLVLRESGSDERP